MFIFGFSLFAFVVVGIELYSGVAIIGWTGNNMVVEREKHPGPYWFAIAIQLAFVIGIPMLQLYVTWTIQAQ